MEILDTRELRLPIRDGRLMLFRCGYLRPLRLLRIPYTYTRWLPDAPSLWVPSFSAPVENYVEPSLDHQDYEQTKRIFRKITNVWEAEVKRGYFHKNERELVY